MHRSHRQSAARRARRLTLLLGAALAALTASASPALAGQIVYSTEPADGDSQIRVMNDDGTNDRLLVHENDVPGAEAVYKPYVSPGGDTVVFQARTPSPTGYGIYCGFRCSGIYAYSAGTITRISQPPTDCPPGDLCMGLDVDPRITGGGSHLFYTLIYGEPGGDWGAPQTISTNYFRTVVPGGGDEIEVPETSCGEGSSITPNPAVDGEFAASAYCLDGEYALKVLNVGGGEEQTLGTDDAEFSTPAFRGDGQALAGAEDGDDPGLWLYQRDGSPSRRIAAITWDDEQRPFDTNPTFVGGDQVAFIHGETIRTLPTSCDACGLDQTRVLATATDVDAVAWTAQNLPDPVIVGPGDDGGDAPGNDPVIPPPPVDDPVVTPDEPLVLKAPAKAKLAKACARGSRSRSSRRARGS